MRLTRLEMHGFKSFADRTQLAFEAGVTAIVGPNGCGKSNVSDAVRWVLGEQRARQLRGAKMEEVIFQGSSARRPVNIAEVSLVFDNSDGQLPIGYTEVVITRRLSRSGESDYLLNRAPCRLRDIEDLVRGTGLGADAGVVIEARMIDALLSDRPDDRRELFEEAAGVSLYRDRRRSTERRLEETTVDLSRLDDLIAEVQGQVRALARQRRRAERYEELRARHFTLDLTLARRELDAWEMELGSVEERVAGLGQQIPVLEAAVRRADQAREAAHGARAAAERQRGDRARLANQHREDVSRLESELAVAAERQRHGMARRQRAEQERRASEDLRSRLARDHDAALAECRVLDAAYRAATAALADRHLAAEAVRRSAAGARQAAEEADRRLREVRDARRRLELEREAITRALEDAADRGAALVAEREALVERLDEARSTLEAAEAKLAAARAEATARGTSLTEARRAVADARTREILTRQALARADETVTALRGRVRALEVLERERVGLAPAAATLLGERARFGPDAVLGPLSDFISATASSALLLERYLGAIVHAILVRDTTVADAVRVWHAGTAAGPLLLLPLDAQPADAEAGAVSTLADVAHVAEPARGWVRALLRGVRTVDAGAAFIDARGAVWLPGAASDPGPLQRRAELTGLRGDLEAAAAAHHAAAGEAGAAQRVLVATEEALAGTLETVNAAQQAVRQAEEERGDAEQRRRRLASDVDAMDVTVDRLRADAAELAARRQSVEGRLRTADEATAKAEGTARQAHAELSALESQVDEAREARAVQQVEEAQVQARLQVASDRERRLRTEMDTAAARLTELVDDLTEIERSDHVLAQRIADWQLDVDARRTSLADVVRQLQEAEAAVDRADVALAAAERTSDGARSTLAEASGALHQAELRLIELAGRRRVVRERLEAEWRRPLDELLATIVPIDGDDSWLRDQLATVRAHLEELGPVNPLAIEEHDEELKRLDFLTGQRADLAAARQALQQAIREIDTTAREMFLTTFMDVRENFRRVFLTLFGGGECDLRLENAEAPLECDIEIHASPRGKRTQRIHLLSSGERALVALSLLFGLFLTKPSPFCLLDEVDAPLDDQNVGRFVRMLNEFKQRTQFIIITHNPRTTTEAADAVYGVTMQEPGVSSVVSVRLRERIRGGVIEAVEEDPEAVPVTA